MASASKTMAAESTVLRRVWLALARTTTLFRLNTGMGWVCHGEPQRRQDGSILLPAGRPIALGFGRPDGKPVPGPGDLQGWTSIVVTPEMVGRRVAIYTSIETKESGGGRRRPDQVNWCGQVLAAGGIAGFAKSAEEAQKIVDGYQPPWGA